MSDRYIDFANSSLGRQVVRRVGLPAPLRLQRWISGQSRPVDGALLVGGGPLLAQALPALQRLGNELYASGEGVALPAWNAALTSKLKALVFDASDLQRPEQLIALRNFFQPRSEEHTSELQSREKLVCRL